MCGIFGQVSATHCDPQRIIAGLQYLEYRGYDSWGVAAVNAGRIVCRKQVGRIDGATADLPASTAFLGHTRWATHGAVTNDNAHPHLDCRGRFALIHNGIVENFRELGATLRDGHVFRSQTDTEVLVHLLEEEIEASEQLVVALMNVFRKVEGLSAVAVLDAWTGHIAVAKNGSPVVLGMGDHSVWLASDAAPLADYTTDVTFLEDGQAAELSAGTIEVRDIASGTRVPYLMRRLARRQCDAGLNGFRHFMAKEIHQQPEVLRRIAREKTDEVTALADAIADARDVYLVGCGTAHHAALSARYMLAQIGCRASTAAVASELGLIMPQLGRDSLVIAFSQSGETVDVLEAVRAARARGAAVAAITNAEGSALHRLAGLTVLLEAGPERCVLATKSYTAKLAVMQLVAHALAGSLQQGQRRLMEAADRMDEVLAAQGEGTIRRLAGQMADRQHMFVLGRDRDYPLALEAALKVKEVSYLHAEGFAAGELKHGVIALITPGTPCLILAPEGPYRREALAAAAEVQARGAFTVGLSPTCEPDFGAALTVRGRESAPYEIALYTQLLAYELALVRGCDPDRPRNLAKSVTVK